VPRDEAGVDEKLRLTALTVISGLLELVTQWDRHQISVSRMELIAFMTALVVATTDISGELGRQLKPRRKGKSRPESIGRHEQKCRAGRRRRGSI